MKRIAFLFGNTDGLKGVKKDIKRFRAFLESDVGGAWESWEIDSGCDLALDVVRRKIGDIRRGGYDYVIVYFSGHGGMIRTTKLCLNSDEECIDEGEFAGLAGRQLSIFDCCRASPDMATNSKVATFDAANEANMLDYRYLYRARYERLIEKASPQDVRLYACQKYKKAYDTSKGGMYTQQLIDDAIEQSKHGNAYVKDVHRAAASAVRYSSMIKGEYQEPDIETIGWVSQPNDLVFAVQKEDRS